jgi:hypothetical protein
MIIAKILRRIYKTGYGVEGYQVVGGMEMQCCYAMTLVKSRSGVFRFVKNSHQSDNRHVCVTAFTVDITVRKNFNPRYKMLY